MATWEEYGLDPKKLWPNPHNKKEIQDTKDKKNKNKGTIKLIVPKSR